MNVNFDGGTTDNKYRTISLSFEIESNFPYFHPRTIMEKNNTVTVYAHDLRIPQDNSTRIEETQKREKTAELDKLKILYNEGVPLEDAVEPDLYEKIIEDEDGTSEG